MAVAAVAIAVMAVFSGGGIGSAVTGPDAAAAGNGLASAKAAVSPSGPSAASADTVRSTEGAHAPSAAAFAANTVSVHLLGFNDYHG